MYQSFTKSETYHLTILNDKKTRGFPWSWNEQTLYDNLAHSSNQIYVCHASAPYILIMYADD